MDFDNAILRAYHLAYLRYKSIRSQSERLLDPKLSDYENFKAAFEQTNTNRLSSHRALPATPAPMKSIAKAETLRIEGNRHFKKGNFATALDHYNKSLSKAPVGSHQYGFALGNRSAVLFALKKYKPCLLDIKHVFQSLYPVRRFYNIYIRQANCLLELYSYDDAEIAIKNARSCFTIHKSKLPKPLHSVILQKIAQIEEKIKVESMIRLGGEVVHDDGFDLPELKNGENPKFVGASNAVDIKKNARKGRYVVAKCNIQKGDVLFVEEPYSFAIGDNLHCAVNFCSYCLKYSMVCLPCYNCPLYFYCTEKCRRLDKDHHWKCLASQTMKTAFSYKISLVFDTIFRASRTGFKTIVEDNTVFGSKDDNYPYVHTLITHPGNQEDNNEDVMLAVDAVMYLLEKTYYFNWLYAQPNRPDGSRDELIWTVGSYILKHLRQLRCNDTHIREIRLDRDDYEYDMPTLCTSIVAVGLYVSSSLLNHSCAPNTVDSYQNSTKLVVATENIQKGSEITISYLSERYKLQSKAARQRLLNRYHFTCTCPDCTRGTDSLPVDSIMKYDMMQESFKEQGNLKMCCAYMKLMLNSAEHCVKEEIIVRDWARYSYMLSKYARILKQKRSKAYDKTVVQAADAIERTVNMLQYTTNERCLTNFIIHMTEYLHSDVPTLQLEYIYGSALFVEE